MVLYKNSDKIQTNCQIAKLKPLYYLKHSLGYNHTEQIYNIIWFYDIIVPLAGGIYDIAKYRRNTINVYEE